MIDYRRLGYVSEKQHTICELNGKQLIEHVITRDGFNDLYSILYQMRAPTHETKSELYKNSNPFFPHAILQELRPVIPQLDRGSHQLHQLKRRHFKSFRDSSKGTLLEARATFLYNNSCTVGLARVTEEDTNFFSNSDADEIYFVNEGSGIVQTIMGELEYKPHDYIFLPKSIPYRFKPTAPSYFLIVEGKKQTGIPKDFRNAQGQLKLDAPYNHRDFQVPTKLLFLEPNENPPIIVKRFDELTLHAHTDFPYQVVGWDGWYWPFTFPMANYQPKTSNVHLPPSVHTMFAGANFYIMNFVPRLLDYHPKAVPCPWPHSNIDCDELLFYVDGNFTSRRGIGQYSMSFHPGGIPHGPHPEKYEKSIGLSRIDELAIMVDTFEPLLVTKAALKFEDEAYPVSWDSKEFL